MKSVIEAGKHKLIKQVKVPKYNYRRHETAICVQNFDHYSFGTVPLEMLVSSILQH